MGRCQGDDGFPPPRGYREGGMTCGWRKRDGSPHDREDGRGDGERGMGYARDTGWERGEGRHLTPLFG